MKQQMMEVALELDDAIVKAINENNKLSIELKSCRRQLRQKDDTIADLNRKLTNSKKPLDVYKKKASNNIEVLWLVEIREFWYSEAGEECGVEDCC
jgi:regulator of replication initiation timing